MDIHTFSVGMQRPSQSDTLVLWDAVYAGGGLVAYVNNGPAMAAHIAAANPATVLALLDEVARLRAAWEEMIPSSLDGMSYDAIMRYRAEALKEAPDAD